MTILRALSLALAVALVAPLAPRAEDRVPFAPGNFTRAQNRSFVLGAAE